MRVIIDVMGADNAPSELIKGAVLAKKELGIDETFVGDENVIIETLNALGENVADYKIINEPDFISMEDSPMEVTKRNSSMRTAAMALARGEGDGLVSCGNTGALFTISTVTIKTIDGVRRAALASIMPFQKPTLILDVGANVETKPEQLLQFAYLGSAYAKKTLGVDNPRVGLLCNGTEEHKGTTTIVETHKLLKEKTDINFIGNVEGKEMVFDACDVVVCDGFLGNVTLKTIEGTLKLVLKTLGAEIKAGNLGNVNMNGIMSLKTKFDPSEVGGAPFIGLKKPVVKAHGNSDAYAFRSSIKQLVNYYNGGAIEEIAKASSNFAVARNIKG